MCQKGWRGFELLFLMPLKKQAIKLGDHKHHYQGGQQTQNVRAGDYNPVPGSPQSFIWAHGFNTENFITCTFVLLGVTAVSAFLKTYVRSSKTALLLLYARNNDNIDKLFQAIGWRKLSHQRLLTASVLMFKTLHGLTPELIFTISILISKWFVSTDWGILRINWLFHIPAPII